MLAEQAAPTAIALLRESIGSTDQNLISTTVDLWQRMLDAIPAGHPYRAVMLTNLGIILQTRFERTGVLADLDAAIEAEHAAVAATPPGHPDRPGYLSNLGDALRARFEHTGVLADLEAAIEAGRAAVDATSPDRPDRAVTLTNLGNALRVRFEHTGVLADLEAAIALFWRGAVWIRSS